jgi:DNA-directed RNA polymerase subunit RPC12/RpoP
MSTYTCSKCGKELGEGSINPQIQRLKQAGITSMAGFPPIVINDPYLYRGTYCTRCNKAFCPDCSHMQMQICPECGQKSLMGAYRPLLNKIPQKRVPKNDKAQTPAKKKNWWPF